MSRHRAKLRAIAATEANDAPKTLLALATAFEITPTIHVERRSGGLWCIASGFECLNADGKWEHEPTPSNRDAGFIQRTRFSREEAFRRARAYVEQHGADQ